MYRKIKAPVIPSWNIPVLLFVAAFLSLNYQARILRRWQVQFQRTEGLFMAMAEKTDHCLLSLALALLPLLFAYHLFFG